VLRASGAVWRRFGPYFRGRTAVSAGKAALALGKKIEGQQTGQNYKQC
jgi:hypothetical protein